MTLPNSLFIGSTRYVSETAATPQATHRVLTDGERGRLNRIGLPMAYWFAERGMYVTKEWQLFLRAINPGMTLEKVSALLNDGKMCSNDGDGFGVGREKQNHILQEGLDPANPLPRFTKVFTCGGSVVRVIDGMIQLFDGNMPPPLADGLTYPLSREQALDPMSYRYLPENAPHLFYAAVNTGRDGVPTPFPNGAVYSWYRDGRTPVTFLPHVAPGGSLAVPTSTVENAARLVRI